MDDQASEGLGCARCWPASADAAWEARRGLACVAGLVDEAHFHVMVLACRVCGQRFVSVFTETVDWADGEDPQAWSLLPLTGAEADGLVQRLGAVAEADLNALGPGRRCLRRDLPKGAETRCYWGFGLAVGGHD